MAKLSLSLGSSLRRMLLIPAISHLLQRAGHNRDLSQQSLFTQHSSQALSSLQWPRRISPARINSLRLLIASHLIRVWSASQHNRNLVSAPTGSTSGHHPEQSRRFIPDLI